LLAIFFSESQTKIAGKDADATLAMNVKQCSKSGL